MREKEAKKVPQRRVRAIGLNLILWLTFLFFSIILIVFFTIAHTSQLNRLYRQREEDNLAEAGSTLKSVLSDGTFDMSELNGLMLSIANQYSVSAYLFRTRGADVIIFPEVSASLTEEYAIIYEMVSEQFEKVDEDMRDFVRVTFTSDDFAGYATIVRPEGRECYLFLSSSFEHFNAIIRETKWLAVITALFAVALSFFVSGVVSMIITKPVTAVTERAKGLARGEFELNPGKGYFCIELNELSEALDYASTEISKTDKVQKELIANVSHDFKTPLTMIKAYASMIKEIAGDDPLKRDKHTQIIIDEADRLTALVGDLLDLSRLQAGIDSGDKTVFNLSEEVYRIAGRFDYLAEMQEYQIGIEVEEDLYTCAQKERIDQVIYNLIGNAVNYTGEDKRVVIRLGKRENCARFEVLDTGRGIPAEELDTIWERYYRSSESHKRPVKGTGLGLAIVKGVLLRQGIPFGVDSQIGKGSCFWVDFPDPPDPEK